MKRCAGFFSAVLSLGTCIAASWDARKVSSEEVAAALESSPVEDRAAESIRIGTMCAGAWIARGEVSGKTVFHEDFSDRNGVEARWDNGNRGKPAAEVVEDGRGGSCVELSPVDSTWSSFVLKDGFLVPVSPDRPYALLWEVRARNGGNAIWIRIDFFDKDGKMLNASYQSRSTLDPTQPHLFQRNVRILNLHMPSEARYVRPYFFLSRKSVDKQPGEIADVRVVDYGAEVEKVEKARRVIADERIKSREDVLVYCDDNLVSSFPVLPQGEAVPGRAGDRLVIRECPGEKTRATAVLWAKRAYGDVRVEFSSCRGPDGRIIPPSAFSAKVVKAHYQGEGAPHACPISTNHSPLLLV